MTDIGSALSTALLRSGLHTVYGIARTESKAKSLVAQEIIPVITADPIKDPSTLLSTIKSANIDTVIDCAGTNQDSLIILDHILTAGRARLENLKQNGISRGGKLGFVYVSGGWVHGNSLDPVTDLDPVGTEDAKTQPPGMVAWRPGVERAVLAASDVLDVAIARPALVYGRAHGNWTPFFLPVVEAAKDGSKSSVDVNLDHGRPPLIHVDDIAEGLLCVINKVHVLAGTGAYPVFDLVGSHDSMVDVLNAFGRSIGFKGKVELVGAGNDYFAVAMSTSVNLTSARAKMHLGWEAKRIGLVEGMDVYSQAFLAALG